MIIIAKDLYGFIDTIMKPHGFVRKKETYYLHTEDCICYLVVEKSPYSGKYGLAMGCFYKKLLDATDKFPDYGRDNLRMSVSALADRDTVQRVFDLEDNEFIKSERETQIAYLIEKCFLPFLNEVNTKEGIVAAIKKYEGHRYQLMADLAVKRALGIPCDD